MSHILKTLMFGAIFLAGSSVAAEVTDAEIEASYHEKAVMTQLLRWYQYYENVEIEIANQLDILDEGFSVTSPSGTATGHEEYEAAVSQFPDTWQNAHDLQSITVIVNDDGTLGLTAEIIFSNLGMTDNLVAQRMGYEATLAYSDGDSLPKFTNMTITPVGSAELDTFADTYVQNRLTTLVAYWIHLVENPARDAEPFREILAPTLNIKFSAQGEMITSYTGIEAWVAGPVSSLPATRHVIEPVTYTELEAGRYEVSVGFDWQGIRPDGKRMTAKTAHTWVVTDDPTERFARVERIRVETIEPFAVVE